MFCTQHASVRRRVSEPAEIYLQLWSRTAVCTSRSGLVNGLHESERESDAWSSRQGIPILDNRWQNRNIKVVVTTKSPDGVDPG